MTVMVEKARKTSLDDLGLPGIPDGIKHLPHTVLFDLGDGGSRAGDLDAAAAVAKHVYEGWEDPEWRNAFILGLISYIESQYEYHRGEIQHMLDQAARKAGHSLRRSVMKAYVNDVLNETVQKAERKFRVRDYMREGRRVHGYEQTREQEEAGIGPAGTGSHTGGRGGYAEREANPESLGYGMGYEPNSIEAQRAAGLAMAQRTYDAYANTLAQSTEADKQAVEYTVLRGDGRLETHRPKAGTVPNMGPEDVIIRAKPLGIPNPVTLGGTAFNLTQALGTPPRQAARSGAIAQNLKDALVTQDWGGRLVSTVGVLNAATNGANPQLGVAMQMARAVHKHGPEVSKVLGPHVLRQMYRYRGVEADPSQLSFTARAGRQTDAKGNKESIEAFQHKLTLNLADKTENGGLEAVPTNETALLMLKSGNTPPSHGYVLDKTGAVKSQAHNYSDDWYVPFNLKHLNSLNGGSYVRSRSWGGPTTEDFALALRTGASSFNVISRNGIYRVEMSERANKSRTKAGAWVKDSANDANTAVVKRYGRLLDAIQSGKVTDPAEGNQVPLKLDGHGYAIALDSLRKQFPYLIKSVDFHPAGGEPGNEKKPAIKVLEGLHGANETDEGYIRPLYLKPSKAMSGYWDQKLGGSGNFKSYDEDTKYRLNAVNRLLHEHPTTTTTTTGSSGVIVPGNRAPRGEAGAPAPTTTTRQQQETANAVGGDFGTVTSETNILAHHLNDADFGKYVNWLRASLESLHLENPELSGDDIDMARALEFTLHGRPENRADFERQDTLLHHLRTDPDARGEVDSLMEQLGPFDAVTGLPKHTRPVLHSIGETDPESEARSERDQQIEDGEDEYKEYKAYVNLKRQQAANIERTGDKNYKMKNPESQALIDKWEGPTDKDYGFGGRSLIDIWTEVHEGYEGLPYWQHYENMLRDKEQEQNNIPPERRIRRWEPPAESEVDLNPKEIPASSEDMDESKRKRRELDPDRVNEGEDYASQFRDLWEDPNAKDDE